MCCLHGNRTDEIQTEDTIEFLQKIKSESNEFRISTFEENFISFRYNTELINPNQDLPHETSLHGRCELSKVLRLSINRGYKTDVFFCSE